MPPEAWLFSDQHMNFTATAHNARGYDSYFLFRYLVFTGEEPNPIFTGNKIMYFIVRNGVNIRCCDFLNIVTQPLSKLPSGLLMKATRAIFHISSTLLKTTPMSDHTLLPRSMGLTKCRRRVERPSFNGTLLSTIRSTFEKKCASTVVWMLIFCAKQGYPSMILSVKSRLAREKVRQMVLMPINSLR